jgi:hypothetical protein
VICRGLPKTMHELGLLDRDDNAVVALGAAVVDIHSTGEAF